MSDFVKARVSGFPGDIVNKRRSLCTTIWLLKRKTTLTYGNWKTDGGVYLEKQLQQNIN